MRSSFAAIDSRPTDSDSQTNGGPTLQNKIVKCPSHVFLLLLFFRVAVVSYFTQQYVELLTSRLVLAD